VEELLKVRMVDVREDPEHLAIQVLASDNVVFGEVVGSCGERGRIIEQVLAPSEDKVDVDRCGEFNWLAVGIYPCIVEAAGTETSILSLVPEAGTQPAAHAPRTCSHRWT
jgi:hypothetical protein